MTTYLNHWHKPEWWSPGDYDYDQASAASDVDFLTECEVTHNDERGWFWLVKATSNLSEWPEVQDAGPCESLEDGQRQCERTVCGIYERREKGNR